MRGKSLLHAHVPHTYRETGVAPVITIVKPAVVPLSGQVPIMLQGSHFMPGCEVLIGGVRCDVLLAWSSHHSSVPASETTFVDAVPGSLLTNVRVTAPAQSTVGPKSLVLINPDRQTAILEHVLFYTDDISLL